MLHKLLVVFVSCIVVIFTLEVLMYIDGYKKLRGFSTGGLAGEEGSPAEMFRRNEERKARKTGMVKGLGSPNNVVEEEINEPISPVQDYFDMLYRGNEEYLESSETEEMAEGRTKFAGYSGVGYDGLATQKRIESIIRQESKQRGINADIAIRVYRKEGLNSYQSKEEFQGKRETSYGPFQLFINEGKVKGLGNDYQRDTGGNLSEENNLADITRQIRWSLDYAAKTGSWSPWRGTQKKTHGGIIEPTEGLSGAKPIGNWRD